MRDVNIALDAAGILLVLFLFGTCRDRESAGKQLLLFRVLLFLNGCLLLSDLVSWQLEGGQTPVFLRYLIDSVPYAIGCLMETVFAYYLLLLIGRKRKPSMRVFHVILGITVTEILLYLVSLPFGWFFSYRSGVYERGPLFWLGQAFPLAIVLLEVVMLTYYRRVLSRREMIPLLAYGVGPFIALLIKMLERDLSLTYVAVAVSMLMVYFGVHEEQTRRLKESETELASMQVSIMLSQIQPHFLYNTLSNIQELCRQDAGRARDALGDFSKYLRGNMDSLSWQKPIHFSRELEHIKHYLNLEKIRFGDKMEVRYEIEESDFFLPALTLQPIVENAVKYGIGNARNGGTIIIRTRREGKAVRILIIDNGVGFPAESIHDVPVPKDRKHPIGLHNVRSRIQMMVGGELDLHSGVKTGTVVTITIPKE